MHMRMQGILTILILLLSASRSFPSIDTLSSQSAYKINYDNIVSEVHLSQAEWKYSPGDNIEWSQPDFNDSGWVSVIPSTVQDIAEIGWFRLRIDVDSTLVNMPLGFVLWQAGTSHLYLNGKLLYKLGESGDDWIGIPKTISFDIRRDNVIALRYAIESIDKYNDTSINPGFHFQLGQMERMSESRTKYERTLISYQMSFTFLMLAVGVVFLILYAFLPNLKQNLLFALFLFFYAATIYFDYQHSLSINTEQFLFNIRMHRAMYTVFIVLQLRFLYALFYKALPKHFWIILIGALIIGAIVTYKPTENFEYFDLIEIVIMFEIIRVITMAFINKKEGAWIITAAFVLYYTFGIFDSLMDSGLIVPFIEMQNPYAIGSIGFILAMSIHLSRDFARTNKKLANQEVEQKLLEAENARQAKELEEARQLQLSMLPKELPKLKHLDIAVYMKTATEVGGDYYDFKLNDDETLTTVIGDATGHGMQAGTMVAATKSLFNALADESDPLQFIKKSSDAIKAMGLKKMFMALAVLKIKNNHVHIASAGMPFPLIYRSDNKQVNEVIIKGMPLGAVNDFPYEAKSFVLKSGDTILLCSDGFEEMFNKNNEMFGTNNVKKLFQEVGTNSPDKIIEHLIIAGEKWAGKRNQEDDVTFVVIKFL